MVGVIGRGGVRVVTARAVGVRAGTMGRRNARVGVGVGVDARSVVGEGIGVAVTDAEAIVVVAEAICVSATRVQAASKQMSANKIAGAKHAWDGFLVSITHSCNPETALDTLHFAGNVRIAGWGGHWLSLCKFAKILDIVLHLVCCNGIEQIQYAAQQFPKFDLIGHDESIMFFANIPISFKQWLEVFDVERENRASFGNRVIPLFLICGSVSAQFKRGYCVVSALAQLDCQL